MVFPTFAAWAATYGKVYNGDETAHREGIYNANIEYITAENQKGNSYTLGVNQFTDLTQAEFKEYNRLLPMDDQHTSETPSLGVHRYEGEALDDEMDWVTKGVVHPVKDQGQCGSCWAFSARASLESAWALLTNNLMDMSEQQLVDCSKASSGCGGGYMMKSFEYDETTSTCTGESYPYKAKNGACHDHSCQVAIPKGGVTGYKEVEANSEQALMSALQVGPVSVAIEADQSVFQHYSSGIIDSGCGTNLDHGVLLVGYGTEGGKKYWKIKNSWGASWGNEGGFVRVARPNMCGILGQPSYPTVKKCDSRCCGTCDCTDDEVCGTVNPCCANQECCSTKSEQCCDGGCAHGSDLCCGQEGGGVPCDAQEHCGAGTCCRGPNQLLPGSKTGELMCCGAEDACGEVCLENKPFDVCCNGHIGSLSTKCCTTDTDCPFHFAGQPCCDGICCAPQRESCDSSTKTCTKSFDEMV